MKKKFVKGMLMAAIAVAPMSFLTSCTDHEEDRLQELQTLLLNENSPLRDIIKEQTASLEKRIADLEEAQKACRENCENISIRLNEFIEIAKNTYVTKDELTKYVQYGDIYSKAQIDAMIEAAKCKCEFNKDEVIQIINQYITDNKYITQEEVQNIINNFMKDVYTKTEVTNLLKNYITNEYLTKNYYTKEEIMNLINQYTGGYTKEEIDRMYNELLQRIIKLEEKEIWSKEEIQKYLKENYYSKEELINLLSVITQEHKDSILNGWTFWTREEIIALINEECGGQGGMTRTQVETIVRIMLNERLKEYYTKEEILKLFAEAQMGGINVDSLLSGYIKKSDLITKEGFYVLCGVNFYSKEQVDSMINNLVTQQLTLEVIRDQILLAQSEIAQAIASTQIIQVGANTMSIQEAIDSLFKMKSGVNCACGDLTALRELVNKNDSRLDSLIKATADSLKAHRDALIAVGRDITTINGTLDDHETRIAELESKVAVIDTLKNRIAALEGLVIPEGCQCDFDKLVAKLDTIYARLSQIPDLSNLVTKDELKDWALKSDLENLKNELKNALADSLQNYTPLQLFNSTIGEVNQKINNVEKALNDKIDALTQRVEANEGEIEDLWKEIEKLATKEELKALQDQLNQMAKQVTSISIDGAYSPVLGEGAAPLGVQLNVLAAYHGEALADIVFPGSTNLSNPNEVDVFTNEDAQMLRQAGFRDRYTSPAGNLYFGKDEGKPAYAGKLYFTINPNTVDFSGINLTIENSQGWKPSVSLNNVVKSDHKLSFGYTRAANGFYEADAEVDMSQYNSIQARVNLSDLKAVAKNLKNYRTEGLDVTKLITTIYSALNDVLDRYAIAAEYTDATGTHKTYSRYDLAATVVKPLGFHNVPLESYARQDIPGLDRIEEFYDKLVDRILDAVGNVVSDALETIDRDKLRIDKLESQDGDPTLYYTVAANAVTITFAPGTTVQDITWWETDENGRNAQLMHGQAILNSDGSVTVVINIADIIRRLYNDIADPVTGALDVINDVLDRFENFDYYADKYAGQVKDFIWKYIDDINSRFQRYMDPNKYLATVMFVECGDHVYTRLTGSYKRPYKMTSTSVKFLPTTFNAEIISPAYKKFVAVTNVWNSADLSVNAKNGDADCLAELKSANGQEKMMEVIEGNKLVVPFTGKVGYKYEILYSALDFEGKVMNRKYYIRF